MKIWKNTSTLNGFDSGLTFTNNKNDAEIALIGSKSIQLKEMKNLKAIFRAGIGKDNVPIKEAENKGLIIRFPSKNTINIIFEETASFTCSLIFKMLYHDMGDIDSWTKFSRNQLSKKTLLIIGKGNIGSRVEKLMRPFMFVKTFDELENSKSELKTLIQTADCISLHIPKTDNNISFFDKKKLSWMKDGSILINTSRGAIVDEEAIYNEIKINRLKAAFDVFWQEPYFGKLIKFHPHRFLMSPHIASTCSEFLSSCRKDLDSLINNLS